MFIIGEVNNSHNIMYHNKNIEQYDHYFVHEKYIKARLTVKLAARINPTGVTVTVKLSLSYQDFGEADS